MCPDREVLSAYCDDEVPSPWKEKIESHLIDCNSCKKVVAGYRQVRSLLQESAPAVDVEETGRRVAMRVRAAGPRVPVKKKQVSFVFAAVAAAADMERAARGFAEAVRRAAASR
jgi:anti-sigma factor RsiW